MQRRSSRRRKPSDLSREAKENNAKALTAMLATPPPPPKKAKKTPTAPKKKIKAKQSTLSMDIGEEDDITPPVISREDWKRIKSDPTDSEAGYISLEDYVKRNPSVGEFSNTIDQRVNTLHNDLVRSLPAVGEYVKTSRTLKKIVVLGSPAIGKSSVVGSLLSSLQDSRATKPPEHKHSPDDMDKYKGAVEKMYSDPLRGVVVSLPTNWIVCNSDFATRDAGEYKGNHTPNTLQTALMTDDTYTIFDVASTPKLDPLLTTEKFTKEQVLYVIVYAPFIDNIRRMVGRCREGKRCFPPSGASYKSIYNDFISTHKGTKNIVIIKNTKRPSSGEKRRAGLKRLDEYLSKFKIYSTLKSVKSYISNRRSSKKTVKNRKKHNTR